MPVGVAVGGQTETSAGLIIASARQGARALATVAAVPLAAAASSSVFAEWFTVT